MLDLSGDSDFKPEIDPVNETSLLVRISHIADKKWPPVLADIAQYFHRELGQYITDIIPAYTTLLICFDDDIIDLTAFFTAAKQSLLNWQTAYTATTHTSTNSEKPIVTVPVFYDATVAPDLLNVAVNCQLKLHELIQIHSQTIYTVYAIGFAPGFAFMGDVDQRICVPRLATPRKAVPSGSVGIADRQTGIYPTTSPGGWNIIGRSPKTLFFPNADADKLCSLKIGDQVKFSSITKAQFLALGGREI